MDATPSCTAPKNDTCFSKSWYLGEGKIKSVINISAPSNPRDTFTTRWKLINRSPEPITSTVPSATSALTRAARSRPEDRVYVLPQVEVHRVCCGQDGTVHP